MRKFDNLYIDTLTADEIARLEARLRPGQSSIAGFLGYDESLKEVIYEDARTLERLGVTHEQVADRLESVVSQSRDSEFKVKRVSWRGCQSDPFQEGFSMPPHSSTDYTVANQKGESITFPGLIIHLIRKYQFFEGKGTSYRLDPEKAVRVLGIKPGVSR